MKAGVELIGAEEVLKAFPEAVRKLMEREAKAFAIAAEALAGQAAARAPKASGHLSSSITGQVAVSGMKLIGRYGTNVQYGKYTEYGTPRTKPGDKIFPKTKKALAFTIAGQKLIRKWVRGIKIGTPRRPRTIWAAKTLKRAALTSGQLGVLAAGIERMGGVDESMPWLRAAWFDLRKQVIALLRKAATREI